jgi:hypothetical protein
MPRLSLDLNWDTYERLEKLAKQDEVSIESLACRALRCFLIDEEVRRFSSHDADLLTRQDHLLGSDECMDMDLSSPSETI